MSLFRNKKALTGEEWFAGATILIMGFIIVFAVQKELRAGVEEKSAFEICRGSIALKSQTGSISPALCKTFDKVITPKGNTLGEQKAYVSEEILKLSALCWYETGSGRVPDIWKGTFFNGENCFICFTFTIKPTNLLTRGYKITRGDLYEILLKKAYVFDRVDDNCAKTGGGFCIKGDICTNENYPGLLKKTDSTKCGMGEVCCVSENIGDDCINFGGRCKYDCSLGDSEYKNEANWKCSQEKKCCVTDNMAITYLEYIQDYEGEGSIYLQSEYKVGNQYIISLVDPSVSRIGELLRSLFTDFNQLKNPIIITELNAIKGECTIKT